MGALPATCIVISWDGHSRPLGSITIDAVPEFDIVLFDYSGKGQKPDNSALQYTLLSHKTECKGQIFAHVADYFKNSSKSYDYVSLLDDDIEISVSGLNSLLHIAATENFDVFAPALSRDSYYSHKLFLVQPGRVWHSVAWIEVMMPFYRYALFRAASVHFANSISSYGIDQFAFAMVQRTSGMTHVAVIDAVVARHARAITSQRKIYSNGMTAAEERQHIRRATMRTLAREHPALVGTPWYYRTFAPLNGPLRFWGIYLSWPFHALKSMFRQ